MNLEVNFDGLIGPSHNYGGLSLGNMASAKHKLQTSYPKKAALQGLDKMQLLMDLGYQQGFLLPQLRPDLKRLRNLGFSGSNEQLIASAAADAPELLALIYSASSMWAANAATVTPSADTTDGKVHFTPANLVSTAHRAVEHEQTSQCIETVFSDKRYFSVHPPLTATAAFGDEGAANHNRFCSEYLSPGHGVFVYGQGNGKNSPAEFPARQTFIASQSIARQHCLTETATFVHQNPAAIDAGAFHNDVVAVVNGPVMFYHQDAFTPEALERLRSAMQARMDVCFVKVPRDQVSLQDAISSYLFNSQLLASATGNMADMRLIAPTECRENSAVYEFLKSLCADQKNPINEVCYVDVRQSMSNGGGPACLRLRVVLNEQELEAVDQRFLLDQAKVNDLRSWVVKHYRDELHPDDLKHADFMHESFAAADALAEMLQLGQYYAKHR